MDNFEKFTAAGIGCFFVLYGALILAIIAAVVYVVFFSGLV